MKSQEVKHPNAAADKKYVLEVAHALPLSPPGHRKINRLEPLSNHPGHRYKVAVLRAWRYVTGIDGGPGRG
jgi:hypothetical protein